MNGGALLNAGIWLGSVGVCAVLYLLGGARGGTDAVALQERHEVIVAESGRLASLEVKVGDRVEAGQQLGTVEVPGLAQELAAAQAQLMALQAATTGGDQERLRRSAKDVAGAQARWLDAKVSLESQRAQLLGHDMELARLRTPGAGVSATQLEQKQAARDALASEIKVREESLGALQAAYATARGFSDVGSDAVLDAQVQVAAAQVEAVRARLEASVLRAPRAGTVTATPNFDGDRGAVLTTATLPASGGWLQAGVPVLTIVEPSTQEAVAYLPPAEARSITPGTALTLVNDQGAEIPARVVAVAPGVEAVPLRQLADPTVVEWGVPVTVRTESAQLLPGEAFALSW